MKTAIHEISQSHPFPLRSTSAKIRAIVVDPSHDALSIVCDLLEFHDLVDLVGRASNADEALGLALALKPDLVLLDIAMPQAHALIAAMMLSADILDVRIIAMSAEDSIPPQAASMILDVNAIIHKASFKHEFLPVFRALFEFLQLRIES